MRRILGTLAAVLAVGGIGISGDGIDQDDVVSSGGAALADRTFQYRRVEQATRQRHVRLRPVRKSIRRVGLLGPGRRGKRDRPAIDNTGDGREDAAYRWDLLAGYDIDSIDNQEIDKNVPHRLAVEFPAMPDEARAQFVGSLTSAGTNSDLAFWGDLMLAMAMLFGGDWEEDWFDDFEEGDGLDEYLGLTADEPGAEPGEPDKYYPTRSRTFSRIVNGVIGPDGAISGPSQDPFLDIATGVLPDATTISQESGTQP